MGQFVKKKVDSRIRTLIENGVKTSHRSIIVVVGDRGKDQVMYLHYMLSKARVAQRPNVLWCYKKELGFSSHRKKRMKQHQAAVKKGLRVADEDDPFELFIAGTDIRYCYYKESHKILGNTYGMCVLQDFEALTPNLLARTVETVEGGGVIVLLLRTIKSLKQLYTMTMDVHSRYRTEAHHDVVARFNERFILSLGECSNCLVVDDELNILPLSNARHIQPLVIDDDEQKTPASIELKELKESLGDTQPVSSLVNQAKTLDQAKAILTFTEAVSEKTLRSTVTLTAARGRGKSAALGIAMASAVAYGYSNIFVTSPSPENLKTLFQFVFKAFDALGYEEHMDYDLVQSTNPEFNKAIVRVNIFRHHRQTIQYIQPQDAHVLGQAELVVIDEAAAIPLPLVKKLLGPYLVFMASTIHGYEGTGRSLSLKLIQQLRQQSQVSLPTDDGKKDGGSNLGMRTLREVKLDEPIRYALNDPAEAWLNKLLCLDSSVVQRAVVGCPHPDECEIFHVNRDTLFSYHPVAENFLQKLVALFVASHYKNTPNDLQLMSDAPAHEIFVLLPPVQPDATTLPEPLVAIQICLEGDISKESVLASLRRGKRENGDLIPWTISQQFQDDDFASLSGARVVRIAVHPDYTSMGYGSRALNLLVDFYEGKFSNLNEAAQDFSKNKRDLAQDELSGDLKSEKIAVRDPSSMPPLLSTLAETDLRARLNWIGVSYGLTASLHKFWKRSKFVPVYLRQTANDLTGEHTCIMLRALNLEYYGDAVYNSRWLDMFWSDFRRRFIRLLGFQFKEFSPIVALSILDGYEADEGTKRSAQMDFSSYDLKRLKSYSNNVLDYHVIIDMIPALAVSFFENLAILVESGKVVSSVTLSSVQKAILLGIGLQKKTVDDLVKELDIPASQLLALFMKMMRKFSEFYEGLESQHIAKELDEDMPKNESSPTDSSQAPKAIDDEEAWDPTVQTLEEDLEEAGDEVIQKLRARQKEMINAIDLSQYAITTNNDDWSEAVTKSKVLSKDSVVVSVKNEKSTKLKRKHQTMEQVALEGKKIMEKNRGKKRK